MDEDKSLDALVQNLKLQLDEAELKANSLRRAYEELTHDRNKTKNEGLRVWVVIREYLKRKGKATVDELIDHLEHERIDLGKYPRRTVKITVKSNAMKNVFKVEQVGNAEVVSLREGGSRKSHPSSAKPAAR